MPEPGCEDGIDAPRSVHVFRRRRGILEEEAAALPSLAAGAQTEDPRPRIRRARSAREPGNGCRGAARRALCGGIRAPALRLIAAVASERDDWAALFCCRMTQCCRIRIWSDAPSSCTPIRAPDCNAAL